MEEEAHRVFRRADIEGKGFLVKKDMQRFQQEVSLSVDQLEAVFESLDACASGFLTIDQFLAGFSNLRNGTVMENFEKHQENNEDDCHHNNINTVNEFEIKSLISKDMLDKSISTLKKMNSLIVEESGRIDIEEGWLQFVQDLNLDMQRLKDQIEELENIISVRDKQHELKVQRLFDEFELQLNEEKEKLHCQMDLKEKALRHEVREKLDSKDLQICDVINQRDELIEKFYNLQVQENSARIKSINLLKIMEEKEEEIDSQQKLIDELQKQINSEKKYFDDECKNHFKEGFFLAQKVTLLEEEGLIQQLKLLKEMQLTIKNDNVRSNKIVVENDVDSTIKPE